jgi:hypothetical protein
MTTKDNAFIGKGLARIYASVAIVLLLIGITVTGGVLFAIGVGIVNIVKTITA